MQVLLIGYGSIGKRHEEVLLSLENIKNVDIVTKQILDDKTIFKSLDEVSDIEKYDYFIIATETSKHLEQLKYLDGNVKDKLIFCEKPLFDTYKELNINNNKVYIGYVLRFHPLLDKLKKLIKDDVILSINANCGQYLPSWRPDSDYRDSYSAKKSSGGGVLLDLSHEIDYIQWLCGNITELQSYQVKISDLEIDSDDLTTFIGKTKDNIIVNLSIDYISKITYRKVLLHTLKYTYELDFIANTLIQKDKLGKEQIFNLDDIERNDMFRDMHISSLNGTKSICTYSQAQEVMKTISKIQEQNNA